MSFKQAVSTVFLLVSLMTAARSARAVILSTGADDTLRYGYHTGAGGGLDANTVHYWSLDEESAPFNDTGNSSFPIHMTSESGLADRDSIINYPPNQRPNPAFNGAQRFGTAGNGSQRLSAFTPTTSTLDDNISLDQANSFFGADGAVTVDMLIRTDFDSTYASGSAMRVISQENDELNPQNLFMAYSNTDTFGHRLEFSIGGASATIPIPMTGDHALVEGGWYHIAASYNGSENTPGNVRMYWTRVLGPGDTTTQANEIPVTDGMVSGNPFFFDADPVILAARPEFTFGNETNGTINKSFDGVFDAIRISNVARGPGDFIFTTPIVPSNGDFNGDLLVDAADYVLWRRSPGSFGDLAGYDVWRATFGMAVGSGSGLGVAASVPEPATLSLTFIFGGIMALRHRRQG
jgi:hypothetical protein